MVDIAKGFVSKDIADGWVACIAMMGKASEKISPPCMDNFT